MLEAWNVTYQIGGSRIVDDVSLRVEPGQIGRWWGQMARARVPCSS